MFADRIHVPLHGQPFIRPDNHGLAQAYRIALAVTLTGDVAAIVQADSRARLTAVARSRQQQLAAGLVQVLAVIQPLVMHLVIAWGQ